VISTTHDWLALRAQRSPDALALLCDNRRWTFDDLHRDVVSTATALRTHGPLAGDRIALLAGNSAGYVRVVHAVSRLGAILVPLNTRLAESELHHQVDTVRPTLLIADVPNQAVAKRLAARRSSPPRVVPLSELTNDVLPNSAVDVAEITAAEIDGDAPHTIIFTSGTTGRPKGALLTHANHHAAALASADNLGVLPDDRWLACLPLFHVGGLSILIRSVVSGFAVVLHDTFDAQAVNRAIETDGVTIVSVVAVMLQRMLDAQDDQTYPPAFRCALLGGGPAPEPLLRRAMALGVPVTQTYGMTETASQLATLAPHEALRKVGSAGKALRGSAIRVDRDGRPAAIGEAGEILVRGPSLSPGYYDDDTATRAAFTDGWFRTGDLGRLDVGGYLTVLDRRDDLIVSGGENVYPAEVEAVLLEHPNVAEAGVYAVADQTWGKRPAALVVARPDASLDLDQLRRHCDAHLAPFKRPQLLPSVPARWRLRNAHALPCRLLGATRGHEFGGLTQAVGRHVVVDAFVGPWRNAVRLVPDAHIAVARDLPIERRPSRQMFRVALPRVGLELLERLPILHHHRTAQAEVVARIE
jgi:O-succinylbenzoic acid--CoA ligase